MNQIPYQDTFLTLSHYKEPLKAIKPSVGYGYYGTIAGTIDGTALQCHICGQLESHLATHIRNSHNMTCREYREKFQLTKKTALVSEELRAYYKAKTILWYANMKPEEKAEHKRNRLARFKAWQKNKNGHRKQPTIMLETKNKRGTCPDQLLAKIVECAGVLKKTPTKSEFIEYCESQRYVHLIYKTFGSWSKALKMCKFQPSGPHNKGGRKIYSDEELLEYLQIFYQENRKPPTYTDSKRGLIPSAEVYKKRWGSLPLAREAAGITADSGRWVTHE